MRGILGVVMAEHVLTSAAVVASHRRFGTKNHPQALLTARKSALVPVPSLRCEDHLQACAVAECHSCIHLSAMLDNMNVSRWWIAQSGKPSKRLPMKALL